MTITLKKESYRGTDGTSLSDKRCKQFAILFDFLEGKGSNLTTYNAIQEEADKIALFGKTNAAKAIRTFCPLLNKLGFINYEGTFPANHFFTKDGRVLIEVIKATEHAKSQGRKDVLKELSEAKKLIQRKGLHNMWKNKSLRSHNIWLAIRIIQDYGDIYWPEFPYAVYLYKELGYPIADILQKQAENTANNVEYKYKKEDGKKLASTVYTYIHSFLLEAGIVEDRATGYSVICDEAEEFLELINE